MASMSPTGLGLMAKKSDIVYAGHRLCPATSPTPRNPLPMPIPGPSWNGSRSLTAGLVRKMPGNCANNCACFASRRFRQGKGSICSICCTSTRNVSSMPNCRPCAKSPCPFQGGSGSVAGQYKNSWKRWFRNTSTHWRSYLIRNARPLASWPPPKPWRRPCRVLAGTSASAN